MADAACRACEGGDCGGARRVASQASGEVTGTPGQQLLVSQLLTRRIADEKLRIADQDGVLSARADVVVAPFVGSLAHLFEKLESWFEREQNALRTEIKQRVKL